MATMAMPAKNGNAASGNMRHNKRHMNKQKREENKMRNKGTAYYKSVYPLIIPIQTGPIDIDPGMSLRQWYKGMAMQALIAKLPLFRGGDKEYDFVRDHVCREKMDDIIMGIVSGSCHYADAMLAEDETREKKEP